MVGEPVAAHLCAPTEKWGAGLSLGGDNQTDTRGAGCHPRGPRDVNAHEREYELDMIYFSHIRLHGGGSIFKGLGFCWGDNEGGNGPER